MFKPEWKVASVNSSEDGTYFVLEVPRQWPRRGEDPAKLDKWFETVGIDEQFDEQFDEQTLQAMAQAECDRRNAEGFELPEDPLAQIGLDDVDVAWITRGTHMADFAAIYGKCDRIRLWAQQGQRINRGEELREDWWYISDIRSLEHMLSKWGPVEGFSTLDNLWDYHHKELVKLAIQMGRDYLAKKGIL